MLERWSVCPDENHAGKRGWTLSKETNVDYVLYTFDAEDSYKYFLLPYQLLRMAFRHNGRKWMDEYGTKFAHSGSWKTEFVCVPASVLIEAINAEMQGTVDKSA